MDYSYNYRYLREFMENHKLRKKDLLEALGCGDYVSLNKWLDGKVPVHVTAMLKFCNYYNIPLDGFFFDGDGIPVDIHPTYPNADSQTLPTDGYGIKVGRGRGIVETHIYERKIGSKAQAAAVREGLTRQTQQQEIREAMSESAQLADTGTCLSNIANGERQENGHPIELAESILRIKLEHEREMRRMEREYREREKGLQQECMAGFETERNRLLDIIEYQNHELSKLYVQTKNGSVEQSDDVDKEQG